MLSHVLKDLKLKTGAEALILSTCNRTEIYFKVKDPNRNLPMACYFQSNKIY